MADKTTLPDLQERSGTTTEPSNNVPTDNRQGIFDKRFDAVMGIFGQACEREGIDVAFAVAIHPQDDKPIVFLRGHTYDAASLAAKVVRRLQHQLMTELSGMPE